MTIQTKLIWLCIFGSAVAWCSVYRIMGPAAAVFVVACELIFVGSEQYYKRGDL